MRIRIPFSNRPRALVIERLSGTRLPDARMAARRIGILGGTFDPIHTGHTDIGTAAEAALELTRIIVIPSSLPPHRPQPIVSSFHRFAMAALTVVGRQRWQISDLELREP